MQEPETDLIDEDVAIRRGMSYRRNAKNHICEARIPTPFPLDVLCEKGIITGDHRFYGEQLIAMRRVFLDPVSIKVGMLRIKQDEGAAVDKAVAIEDMDYIRVLRDIRKPFFRDTVVAICTEDAVGKEWMRYNGGHVPMAFDQLAAAVKALWESKKPKDDINSQDDRFR